MWQMIEYKGFEIHVLPMLKYGPPPPGGAPYRYSGYVCRPGADPHQAGQAVHFQKISADLDTEAEALEAGYQEGQAIVDGTHPKLSSVNL